MQANKCNHVWCLNNNAKFGIWFNCEKCGQKKRPNYLNELEAALQEAQDRIKQLKISVDDRGVRERYSANCAKELNQQVVSLKKINKEQLEQSQDRERVLREALAKINDLAWDVLSTLENERGVVKGQLEYDYLKDIETIIDKCLNQEAKL